MSTPIARIPQIVQTVRDGFNKGTSKPLAWRKDQIRAIVTFLSESKEAIVEALKKDLGRCKFEAHLAEIIPTITELNASVTSLDHWAAPQAVSTPLVHIKGLTTSQVIPEPKGVVLIISPWNYPICLPLLGIAAAFSAGNAVVFKPSEVSENCSKLLAEMLPKYLDNSCFQVVYGAVPETTELLKLRFDHIMYTGNGTVARIVMRAAAEHLTPVTLELGGKSPTIVDKNVDLAVAAKRILWGKYMNAGQTCIAPDYILVHKDIEDRLVDAFKSTLKEFYGENPESSPDYARIINKRQFQRLSKLLEADKDKVIAGGQTNESQLYIAPTLLRNVAPDAPIMREEIFGPLLPILPVDDIESAIRFINERDKPLALYIFTKNSDVWNAVIENTSSGQVGVNETVSHHSISSLPFGGVGESGMGAYHGKWGFDEMSHYKAVLNKTTWFDASVRYPPYTDGKLKLVSTLM